MMSGKYEDMGDDSFVVEVGVVEAKSTNVSLVKRACLQT